MWIFGLAALVASVAACLIRIAWIFSIATRDAVDLAGKVAVSHPVTAIDWPELRIDAVVSDPASPSQLLLVGSWPAHPESRSLLVLDVGAGPKHAEAVLTRWRDGGASISPTAPSDGRVLLRRRRSTESLEARVITEEALTTTPYR